MDIRRIAFWVIVIGFFAWIVSNPSHAGHTASSLVDTVIGWGEAAVTAAAAFATSLA